MGHEDQGEKSRGWHIVDFKGLNAPPEWLVAAVYVLAALLLFYMVWVLALGLYAFAKLGPTSHPGLPCRARALADR